MSATDRVCKRIAIAIANAKRCCSASDAMQLCNASNAISEQCTGGVRRSDAADDVPQIARCEATAMVQASCCYVAISHSYANGLTASLLTGRDMIPFPCQLPKRNVGTLCLDDQTRLAQRS